MKRRRRNPSGRRISCAFEVVTEESAREGDFAEIGWEDKEGESMEPDKWDQEEGVSAVDKAIKFLADKGAIHASGSHFHKGVWFSTEPDQDYRTGEDTTYSFFLKGFTEAEERVIFNAVNRR